MAILFNVRFEKAGSLYERRAEKNHSSFSFCVGPIVSTAFYRSIEGFVEYPDMSSQTRNALQNLRGPFIHTGEYLASSLRALLLKVSRHRAETLLMFDAENPNKAISVLEKSTRIINKAIELCYVYPGDLLVHGPLTTPLEPFTFKFEDFRLVNFLVSFCLTHRLAY
jgi:hypothetical protein